ncbi:hypothetical protein LY76DRAFT_539168, partial [Colletotrichum caudatum]
MASSVQARVGSVKSLLDNGSGAMMQSAQDTRSNRTFDHPPVEDKQPETLPISQNHLIDKSSYNYAALVKVERLCIEGVSAKFPIKDTSPQPNDENWRELINLHFNLLECHQDFFLYSQDPSVQRALPQLPSPDDMPARMCTHGIHSLLELLYRHLPKS